jgi:hypothetical protein
LAGAAGYSPCAGEAADERGPSMTHAGTAAKP